MKLEELSQDRQQALLWELSELGPNPPADKLREFMSAWELTEEDVQELLHFRSNWETGDYWETQDH